MDKINETIDKIIPVIIADNSETAIKDYLKTALTELYDEGFYQGTLNVFKKEYPDIKL